MLGVTCPRPTLQKFLYNLVDYNFMIWIRFFVVRIFCCLLAGNLFPCNFCNGMLE